MIAGLRYGKTARIMAELHEGNDTRWLDNGGYGNASRIIGSACLPLALSRLIFKA